MSTYYRVKRLGAGWVVRPAEWLDNRRWYFDTEAKALEHADYLERQDVLDGLREAQAETTGRGRT